MKVTIEKLDNLGRGITYLNKKICFIENSLPGEIVNIELTKENKKYYEGKVKEYLKISPIRIKEECPYSKECGGCNLNHLNYNDENIFKENKVKELLTKYGNQKDIGIEKIQYCDRNYYRNKITLHGKNKELGLYRKKSNSIIPINKCLIVNNEINNIIKLLQKENKNIEEVTIKTSNDNKQVMISIIGEIQDINTLKEYCNVLRINNKYKTNQKDILTNINSNHFYQSLDSFFQVNREVTNDLYREIEKQAKKTNANEVLDLYCGTGTIGITISKYFKKVIGIDYNPSNIKDANKNKKLNNCSNIEFICDKVENVINKFKNIDLVIVDPPRKGLDINTIKYLKELSAKNIIYISCDPLTLSRDINSLNEIYKVKIVKPFNMFPRTYHCESITVLERR